MKASRVFAIGFGVIALCVLSVPNAFASLQNQATRLTFNGAVEIPGVALPEGTYWFKLLKDDADQNIVQIWNGNQKKLLATVLAIPDYRLHTTGQTVIKFKSEHPSGLPDAIRAWFYPGTEYGHEFVYPEKTAAALAKRYGEPVLSMRNDVSANITKPAENATDPSVVALKHAQVQVVSPNGKETNWTGPKK